LFLLPFALFAASAFGASCAVDDAKMADAACEGPSCDRTPAPEVPQSEVTGTASVAPDAAAEETPVKPGCGVGYCLPDDAAACNGYEPPLAGGGDAGADAGADAGFSPDAGAGDAGPRTVSDDFAPPMPGAAPHTYSCQLSVGTGGGVERSCAVAGQRGANEACTSSLDCAPGLGCVGAARAGRCLPFCCALEGSCQAGTYCLPRPLLSDSTGNVEERSVPVCVPADNCNLSEPANCEGPNCSCRNGTVCTALGTDRATACLPPGRVAEGMSCAQNACQPGYQCSQATATCVRMCDLDAPAEDAVCGVGVCQASPALPTGWGICVGASPAEMASP
jgi:hypothetical protein